MSNARICLIAPTSTDAPARARAARSFATNEGVLGCMVNPTQAVFVGVIDGMVEGETPGQFIVDQISSSLTTVFFVGSVADCERALVQWPDRLIEALNEGLCPEGEDGAVVALWQHPAKDLAMLAVLASGDWSADLEAYLPESPAGLTQVAYSGNDNEPINFLPDFLEDTEGDEEERYDLAETILLTVNEEWHDQTLDVLVERDFGAIVDRYKKAIAPPANKPKLG